MAANDVTAKIADNSGRRPLTMSPSSHGLLWRVLNVRIGTIIAGDGLGEPFAVGGLIFDRLRPSRHTLLGGRAPRSGKGLGVAREALREHPVIGIGPAAVVLDDLVGDMAHRELASRRFVRFAETECAIYSMTELAGRQTLCKRAGPAQHFSGRSKCAE